MKICIICRLEKEKFNDEHVIPDSIRGYYHIHSVCTDCNSRMGTGIDNTLTNHKFVELQRFLLDIRGKSGSIPNPFAGTHHLTVEPNKKVKLEVDDQGAITPRLLPLISDFKKDPLVDSFTVHIDKKDERQLDQIVGKIIRRHGLDKEKLTSKKKEVTVEPFISVTLNIDTQDFKIGMLKIAYEFAVDNIPEYFADNMAIVISKILCKCDFNDLQKQVLFLGSGFDKEILGPFQQLLSFEEKNHYLILSSTDHGLICVINLFNSLTIGVRLSKATNYLNDDILVGKNDMIDHSFRIFNGEELIAHIFTEMSFQFEYHFFDEQSRIQLHQLSKLKMLKHFKDDGNIAFYNRTGKIIYKNIMDKLRTLPSRGTGDAINEMTSEFDIDEELYIKLLPQKKLYQVTKVFASRYRIRKL